MNTSWWIAAFSALPFAIALSNLLTWRRLRPERRDPVRETTEARGLSVLIPARNEQGNIGPLLESVCRGQPEVAEVLVYDDDSSDGTAAIVNDYARRDSRVRLLTGRAIPDGWVGKQHACHRLALEATQETWLFIDADVRLRPGAIAALLQSRETAAAGVVSAVPRQLAFGFFERLILPLLHLTYLAWLPLRLVELTSSPRFTAANGQLLLVRRDAYAAAGGFESVRGSLVDDMAFCRKAKSEGIRVCFADAHEIAECRMYQGACQVWRGFSKNLYPGLGNSPLRLSVVLGFYLGSFVLPYVTLPIGWLAAPSLVAPSAVGVALNMSLRAAMVIRFRHPPSGIVLHPLAVLSLALIAVNSVIWVTCGRIEWAGRRYAGIPGSAPEQLAAVSRRSELFVRLARGYVRRRLRRQFESIEVAGLEATKARAEVGPVILAANHVSWWDPLLLVALEEALGQKGHCLMDVANLRALPFFAWVGAVPIHRDSPRQAYVDLKRASTLARRPKEVLAIFPEGRQRPAHLAPNFGRGVELLARESAACVIPLAIRYDFDQGPRMSVHLSLGAPVVYRPRDGREFVVKVEQAVVSELHHIDEHLEYRDEKRRPPDATWVLRHQSTARHDHSVRARERVTAARSEFVPLLVRSACERVPLAARLLAAMIGGRYESQPRV